MSITTIIAKLSLAQKVIIVFMMSTLIIVSGTITRISATEYGGDIVIKNIGQTPATIHDTKITVVDKDNVIIIFIETTNTPLVIPKGEQGHLRGTMDLTYPINKMVYEDSDIFRIYIQGAYGTSYGRFDFKFNFDLTKTQYEAIARNYLGG